MKLTIDEAIKVLECERDEHINHDPNVIYVTRTEAVNMAIAALEEKKRIEELRKKKDFDDLKKKYERKDIEEKQYRYCRPYGAKPMKLHSGSYN